MTHLIHFLLGTEYDLLLGRKSKFKCIQATSSKGLRLLVACRRWHESKGTTLDCLLKLLDSNACVNQFMIELMDEENFQMKY
jgi:hypothetical protein